MRPAGFLLPTLAAWRWLPALPRNHRHPLPLRSRHPLRSSVAL